MGLVLVVFLLVALNALFVAAEFAIIAAPKQAIERRAAQGSQLAKQVLAVMREPEKLDQYIASVQVGITFASLGLGMYGESRLAAALESRLPRLGLEGWASAHAVASVVAIGALTYIHIVVGEMVPKTLALQHAESTVLWCSTPMRWVGLLMWPLVRMLNAIGRTLLRLVGVRRATSPSTPTSDALRFVVEESVAAGQLDSDAGQVLDELFAFGALSAGEVMTPRVRVVGLRDGASADELRAAVRSARHARYLVYEGTVDCVVGMVLIRDLLELLVSERPLSRAVVRAVPFVPASATLDVVLARMRRYKTQLAVVMDEHGGTSGIVTVEDVFREVIGEIADGQLALEPVYESHAELRTLGVARLAQVGQQLGVELEHPDIDTVSGLVLALLERHAEVGDLVCWRGVRFQVRGIQGRGVSECALELTSDIVRAPPRSTRAPASAGPARAADE